MKSDIGLKFMVKGARRDRCKVTASGLVPYLASLPFYFLCGIFLFYECCRFILAGSWYIGCLRGLGVHGCELSFSSTEGTDVGLPVFGDKLVVFRLVGVFLWPRVSISGEQQVFPRRNKAGCVSSSRILWLKAA